MTLRDVANESGLSTAAVSYALRGLHVPVETQERAVRGVADRLGYQVDPIARALASGRTGYVGLLCGSLTDIWQQGIAADIGRGAARARPACADRRRVQRPGARARAGDAARRSAGGRADRAVRRSRASAHWPARSRAAPCWCRWATASPARPRRRRSSSTTRPASRPRYGCWPTRGSPPDRGPHPVLAQHAGPAGRHRRRHRGARARVGRGAASVPARPRRRRGRRRRRAGRVADPPTAVFCLADSMAYGVYAAARLARDDHSRTTSRCSASTITPVSRLLTPPMSNFRWPVELLVVLRRRSHRCARSRRTSVRGARC